jgi:adhesin transport system outer membrane protein
LSRFLFLPRAGICHRARNLSGRLLLAAGLMLASASVVSASESVPSLPEPPIGLDAALRQAVQTHPSIRSRVAEVRAAGHDRDAAEWARYPALSADANQTEQGDTQSTARVQLPLWTAGRISGQIELARAGLAAAEFSVIEAEQSILLQTASAYAELLRAQVKLQAATVNLTELERLQALIGRRVGTEISPQADATLASARVQQARTERIQY